MKIDEYERSCSRASTSIYVGTLPTDRHGAINRTSSFSLGKKIPKTQKFNNLKILIKTTQNSIWMRTATSYGHNTAKKKKGVIYDVSGDILIFSFFGKNEYLDQHVTNLAPVKK